MCVCVCVCIYICIYVCLYVHTNNIYFVLHLNVDVSINIFTGSQSTDEDIYRKFNI